MSDQPIYGSHGMLHSGSMSQAEYDALPDWLKAQFSAVQDDGGNTTYVPINQTIRGRDGNEAVQIGDPNATVPNGPGSIIDRSKIRYDPDLGWVTTPDNLTPDTASPWSTIPWAQMAALYGGGYLGMSGLEGATGGFSGASAAAGGADVTIPSALSSIPASDAAVGSLDLGGLDSAMSGLGLETGGGADVLSSLGLEPMDPIIEPQVGMLQEPLVDMSPYMAAGPPSTPWWQTLLNNASHMPGLAQFAMQHPPSNGGARTGGLGGGMGAALGRGMSGGSVSPAENKYALQKIQVPGSIKSYLRGQE